MNLHALYRPANSSVESLHEALSAVTHGYFFHLSVRPYLTNARRGCSIGFRRAQATLKRIYSYYNSFHAAKLLLFSDICK